jgi:O-methyltransferase involved in polyketide biosynthesis
MNDISNTALVTLKCHIQDAQEVCSILNDKSSIKMYKYLNESLDEAGKSILNKGVKKNLEKHTALRAKKYDDYVVEFLHKYPEAAVVNIGCGLDNRFERIDNGKCLFIDLDFPDIMNIKQNTFPASERYKQIAKSVFDFSWMEKTGKKPVLLLAEGVFMYCHENDVKSLFSEIHNKIPDSEIVFEVFSSKWLKGWRKKLTDFKLQKQLKFGKDASYKFGIADSNEIERWSEHYKLIEDWSYMDIMKQNASDFLRKIQWTVYYKIK